MADEKEMFIRRCSVCQAIEMNNLILKPTDYNPEELKAQGYNFTDGFLSRACMKPYLEGIPEDNRNKILSQLERETCY